MTRSQVRPLLPNDTTTQSARDSLSKSSLPRRRRSIRTCFSSVKKNNKCMIRWRDVGPVTMFIPKSPKQSSPSRRVPIAPPQSDCRPAEAARPSVRASPPCALGRGRTTSGRQARRRGSTGTSCDPLGSATCCEVLAFGRRHAERTNLAGRRLRRARRLGADGLQNRRQRAGSRPRRSARLAVREQAIHLRAVGGRTESGDASDAGRRNEPIALWIRKAVAAEGRRVRLVHVGRPWKRLDRFDLIVTTPQYSLPARANILLNPTPLHRVTAGRLREAAAQWAQRFAHLPPPRVAVLIGGSIAPYSYDEASAERLAKQASSLAAAGGGSLLVSTSARTPPHTIDALCDHLGVLSYVFRWREDAGENPYFGMLALADAFVVTADSMSMLTEACATGKPVHIFDLGEGEHAMRPTTARTADIGEGVRETLPQRLTRRLHLLVKALTPRQLGRDIGAIHQHLVDAGEAAWLGDPVPAGGRSPRLDGVARAVTRVRALFDLPAEPGARAGHTGRGPLGTDEA